jgi:hypothetical protein
MAVSKKTKPKKHKIKLKLKQIEKKDGATFRIFKEM